MSKVLIIGSGIAGIAASIRLAQKGHEVHVFEANNYPGGKLTSFTNKGFRFDAGPSLFTLPHLVTELFELCGEDYKDHFAYRKLDNICNYFWDDGFNFKMPAYKNEQVEYISKAFDESPKSIERYLNESRMKYELTAPIFVEKSLHKWSTYFSSTTFKALLKINRFGLSKTLNQVNSERFSNPKLIQMFNRFATYNGSSPYKTPGIMSMIPHLEMNIGTFFPEGGMKSITNSLFDLSRRCGVKFHFNSKVDKIVNNGKKASGIKVNGLFVKGDVVVSNMDVVSTYSKLLSEVKQPHKILAQERSSSALIFYWGIKGVFDQLDLHNIFFSETYHDEFESIFTKKCIHIDPTIYINVSSKENSKDAPDGCENWFVMINTPSDTGQDWDRFIAESKKVIVKKINNILKTNIETYIQCEEILDPRKIASKTSSHQGSLYGTSSNSKFSAFLRQPNYSKHLSNVFFCGGSVHPGGGIPLCLNSAKIVSNFID